MALNNVTPLTSTSQIINPDTGRPTNFFLRAWQKLFSTSVLSVIVDRTIIKYNSDDVPTPSSQTVTVTAVKSNTAAEVTWSVKDSLGNLLVPVTDYLSAEKGDSVTMTREQFDLAISVNESNGVQIIGAVADVGGLFKAAAYVAKVQDGSAGDPGAAGPPGSSAKNITLTATSSFFPYDSSNNPLAQTVIFRAIRQNTSATTYWTLRDRDGTILFTGNADALAASGYFSKIDNDSVSITHTSFNSLIASIAARTTLNMTATITDGSITINDVVSIQKADASSIVAVLTNEADTVAATYSGTVPSFSGLGGIMRLYAGGTIQITSGVTFSVYSTTNVTVSINSSTGAYTVSAMSADTGTATLRATYSGITFDKVYTISKSRQGIDGANGLNGINGVDGAPGANGTDGENGVSVELSIYSVTLPCYSDGTIKPGALDLAVTTMRLRSAAVQITSGVTYSNISATSGSSGTMSSSGVFTVTSVGSNNTSEFVLRATYSGQNFDLKFLVVKAISGADALYTSRGLTGYGVTSSTVYDLVAYVDITANTGRTITGTANGEYVTPDGGSATNYRVTPSFRLTLQNLTDSGSEVQIGSDVTGTEAEWFAADISGNSGGLPGISGSGTNSTGTTKTFRVKLWGKRVTGNSGAIFISGTLTASSS